MYWFIYVIIAIFCYFGFFTLGCYLSQKCPEDFPFRADQMDDMWMLGLMSMIFSLFWPFSIPLGIIVFFTILIAKHYGSKIKN